MANRISAVISVVGVFVSAMLLVFAIDEYRAGASALWAGLGAVILLSAAFVLVRDVRALARGR